MARYVFKLSTLALYFFCQLSYTANSIVLKSDVDGSISYATLEKVVSVATGLNFICNSSESLEGLACSNDDLILNQPVVDSNGIPVSFSFFDDGISYDTDVYAIYYDNNQTDLKYKYRHVVQKLAASNDPLNYNYTVVSTDDIINNPAEYKESSDDVVYLSI